jgi:hypothetical protein
MSAIHERNPQLHTHPFHSFQVAAQTMVDGVAASKVIAPIQTEVCLCDMEPKEVVDAHVGHVYAQAFIVSPVAAPSVSSNDKQWAGGGTEIADGKWRLLLLVNTRNDTQTVTVAASTASSNATLWAVDFDHGFRTTPYATLPLLPAGGQGHFQLQLGGFAVAVLSM